MREDINAVYKEKKEYVTWLNHCIKPSNDIKRIEYARDALNYGEYIRFTDHIGGVGFVNVTGNSLEAILKEVCKVMLLIEPTGIVKDSGAKREIAKLFND